MKKFYRQSFLSRKLLSNDKWVKKLFVTVLAILIVIVPFLILWSIYSGEASGFSIKYKVYICYNSCPQTWKSDLRLYFRNNFMIIWLLATSVIAVTGIGFFFVMIDNKLLLFSIVLIIVSLLTNFINWVSDPRGALDYWTLPTPKVPWAFFGLESVIRKTNMASGNYMVINWPDLTFAVGTDIFSVALIYEIIKIIVLKAKTHKNLKKLISKTPPYKYGILN